MTEFPPIEAVDEFTEAVNFKAIVDGRDVLCCISFEALEDNFDARGSSHLHAFKKNRGTIEAIAETLINIGRYESDGRIVIRSADVR